MNIIPILNLNKHPKDVNDLSLVNAANIKLSKDSTTITNENSVINNDIINNYLDGGNIVGYISCSHEIILFLNNGKILRYNEKYNGVKIVSTQFEYHNGIIVGDFTYNVHGELIVIYSEYDTTDGKDYPMCTINFGKYEDDIIFNDFFKAPICPEVIIPSVNFIDISDNWYKGWNFIFIRYKLNSSNDYTQWYCTNASILIDNSTKEYIQSSGGLIPYDYEYNNNIIQAYCHTNMMKKVVTTISSKLDFCNVTKEIIISNIDTRYDNYQLGVVICRTDSTKCFRTEDISINTIKVVLNKTNFSIEYGVDEMITTYNNYYNVKNIVNYKNSIYIANYKEENISELEDFVDNNVSIFLVENASGIITKEYKVSYSGNYTIKTSFIYSINKPVSYLEDITLYFKTNTNLIDKPNIVYIRKIPRYFIGEFNRKTYDNDVLVKTESFSYYYYDGVDYFIRKALYLSWLLPTKEYDENQIEVIPEEVRPLVENVLDETITKYDGNLYADLQNEQGDVSIAIVGLTINGEEITSSKIPNDGNYYTISMDNVVLGFDILNEIKSFYYIGASTWKAANVDYIGYNNDDLLYKALIERNDYNNSTKFSQFWIKIRRNNVTRYLYFDINNIKTNINDFGITREKIYNITNNGTMVSVETNIDDSISLDNISFIKNINSIKCIYDITSENPDWKTEYTDGVYRTININKQDTNEYGDTTLNNYKIKKNIYKIIEQVKVKLISDDNINLYEDGEVVDKTIFGSSIDSYTIDCSRINIDIQTRNITLPFVELVDTSGKSHTIIPKLEDKTKLNFTYSYYIRSPYIIMINKKIEFDAKSIDITENNQIINIYTENGIKNIYEQNDIDIKQFIQEKNEIINSDKYDASDRLLIPYEKYNIYIHFVDKYGYSTSGFFVDSIFPTLKDSFNLINNLLISDTNNKNPNKDNNINESTKFPNDYDFYSYIGININGLPSGYIGWYLSYEKLEDNTCFVGAFRPCKYDPADISVSSENGVYTFTESDKNNKINRFFSPQIDTKEKLDMSFKYIMTAENENLISNENFINHNLYTGDKVRNIRQCSNIAFVTKDAQNNSYKNVALLLKEINSDNINNSAKNKELIPFTSVFYTGNQNFNTVLDSNNVYYDGYKTVIEVYSYNTPYTVESSGIIRRIFTLQASNEYLGLNRYKVFWISSIKDEFKQLKTDPSIIFYDMNTNKRNSEKQYSYFYNVDSANFIDLFEQKNLPLKECFPKKQYNYRDDIKYITEFNNTIRKSNVIQDESAVNAWRKFNVSDYYNIYENKGNITNLLGLGTIFVIHTECSLFYINTSNTISNGANNVIQLEDKDLFDCNYKEALSSKLGFGGLQDYKSYVSGPFGYIWFNNDANRFMSFNEGKISYIDNSIFEWFKDKTITDVVFGKDEDNTRILINFKCNNIQNTISYNYSTKAFISCHSYNFEKIINTENNVYLISNNKCYNYDKCSYGVFKCIPSENINKFYDSKLVFVINTEYDIIKYLEYIIYKVTAKVKNRPEKIIDYSPVDGTDKLYSGGFVRIYNDFIDTNYINIKIDEENKLNSVIKYEKPYRHFGNWNLNLLRDKSNVPAQINPYEKDVYSRLYGNYFIVEFIFTKPVKTDYFEIENFSYKVVNK